MYFFCLIVLVPPAYNQVTDQNDQSKFTYGNQYNQYPGGNQYPSPGSAPYPGNQYQPQYNADGQVMTSVVWSSFISKNIKRRHHMEYRHEHNISEKEQRI